MTLAHAAAILLAIVILCLVLPALRHALRWPMATRVRKPYGHLPQHDYAGDDDYCEHGIPRDEWCSACTGGAE